MDKQDATPYLNDTNWVSWLASITRMFYLKNLDQHLDSSPAEVVKKPDESAADFEERQRVAKRNAKMARAVMRMYMTEKYQSLTEHCETAHATLALLNSQFAVTEKNKVAINIEKLALLATTSPPVEELALKIRAYATNIGDLKVNSDEFMVLFFCALAPP